MTELFIEYANLNFKQPSNLKKLYVLIQKFNEKPHSNIVKIRQSSPVEPLDGYPVGAIFDKATILSQLDPNEDYTLISLESEKRFPKKGEPIPWDIGIDCIALEGVFFPILDGEDCINCRFNEYHAGFTDTDEFINFRLRENLNGTFPHKTKCFECDQASFGFANLKLTPLRAK
ncbi:hypothetical protein [uncultured Desulfobacter sp.]|uniref:hypothetical protein n=1 Tax=uncultured Desulfobacter sp. TaxID=240139 RepID=UPI002AA76C02|nr:hypothetical protein [uncultured Desulfobacter sp.]